MYLQKNGDVHLSAVPFKSVRPLVLVMKASQRAEGRMGRERGVKRAAPFSSPSPFSFLLVGGALARENEGLWRHRIFEFFDWLMENKEILSGSENVHASVFTGKEIKYDDGLPKKLCQPCFRKVKNIKEFRALSLATLSAQELLIGETRMKRVRGSLATGWRITFESTGEKD